MKVSVIIPTYNAESHLTTLLPVLQKQTLPFELIIIDSSSTDKTLEIAKKYTNHIITIPQSKFDHGGTRTKAAKMASGELLIFLTQDALPCNKHTLESITKCFSDNKIAAAYGRQIPYDKTSLFGKHLRSFNYPTSSYVRTLSDKTKFGIKTAFLSDSFAAYRKSTMSEVNWFKDGLILGEDSHIATKLLLADYALAYVSNAQIYHSHSYSLIEEFKRYFDIGVFHTQEHWILEIFGKAEGEGGKYVKSEFTYLLKHKAYLRIPEFFIRNGLKYLGYKFGRNYKIFPKSIVPKLSMHHLWWEK